MNTPQHDDCFTVLPGNEITVLDHGEEGSTTIRYLGPVFSGDQSWHELGDGETHIGFVSSGSVACWPSAVVFSEHTTIRAGMYFVVPGTGRLWDPASCHGMLISRQGQHGLFQTGGPLHERGCLAYIDGCTTTLLVAPSLFGDPSLHYLYVPPGTMQSVRSYPMLQVGMVYRGYGTCVTVTKQGEIPFSLKSGQIFILPADLNIYFTAQAEPLSLVICQVASNWGPHDYDHPLLRGTIIDGLPATQLARLRAHS